MYQPVVDSRSVLRRAGYMGFGYLKVVNKTRLVGKAFNAIVIIEIAPGFATYLIAFLNEEAGAFHFSGASHSVCVHLHIGAFGYRSFGKLSRLTGKNT